MDIDYNKEEVREKFKDLFEHSLDLIYVNDLYGNFLDANELTLISLGYERKDIPNLTFTDILDRDNLIKAYNTLKEVKKTGKQSAQMEYKLKTKTGDYIFIETYSIPLKKNDRLYGILGIAKNITKRKKTAQKLKESAEMFIALFKEGPIPTYTWRKIGDDFALIDFNNAADKITHGHVETFLGTNASEMYKDRPDILNDLHLCINEKTHITREMKYKYNFSKEEKYLLVNYGYVGPDLIIVSTEDITERKKAGEKLKESELKYRNMINNLDVGFYQVSLDGTMINHNPAHNKILEYDQTESLIGKRVTDFWQVPEDRDDYLKQILENSYAKNYICPSLTKEGKKVVVQLNSHLMRNNEGSPIGIEGTFIDITEKYNLEHELRESEEKFRSIAEQSLLGICVIQDDLVKFINKQFADLLGYTVEEVKDWEPEYCCNGYMCGCMGQPIEPPEHEICCAIKMLERVKEIEKKRREKEISFSASISTLGEVKLYNKGRVISNEHIIANESFHITELAGIVHTLDPWADYIIEKLKTVAK